MEEWPARRPKVDQCIAVAVDWCRSVRELQLLLGNHWVTHASQLVQESEHGDELNDRISSLIRSAWEAVDDAARELITLTLWQDYQPSETLTPFDPSLLASDDMSRLIEMTNGLLKADAEILAGHRWVPVAEAVGLVDDWRPAQVTRWTEPDLVDRIVAVLFEDFMAVSDDIALAFADDYAFVSVRPLDESEMRLTFLMSRRGEEWRILFWPSQLFRWAPASKRRGEGGEGAGVREPRVPVLPSISGEAWRSWPPEMDE